MFWSHMRQVEMTLAEVKQIIVDTWILCNKYVSNQLPPWARVGALGLT